jgi:hypothetical protein
MNKCAEKEKESKKCIVTSSKNLRNMCGKLNKQGNCFCAILYEPEGVAFLFVLVEHAIICVVTSSKNLRNKCGKLNKQCNCFCAILYEPEGVASPFVLVEHAIIRTQSVNTQFLL